jgi:hypothetical protein
MNKELNSKYKKDLDSFEEGLHKGIKKVCGALNQSDTIKELLNILHELEELEDRIAKLDPKEENKRAHP